MPRRPRSRFGGESDKILTHFLKGAAAEGKRTHPFFERAIEHYRDEYLRSYNVRGDGHCLFYAVIRCIVSAYGRLPEETKKRADQYIGADVITKFRKGTYLGEPKDVKSLREAVSRIMVEYGDSEECITKALGAVEYSTTGSAVDREFFADSTCHYLLALAEALHICIALEYPFTSGRLTTRKWSLFQPTPTNQKPAFSLYKMLEDAQLTIPQYNRILQQGTQTPETEMTCTHVIYLKLENGHYTSYLYHGEFKPGEDKLEEQHEYDASLALAMQLQEEEEARRQLAQRESEVGSGPVFSDAEIAKQREAYEAFEAAKGAARQRFGAPHRRCSRAFVSHVLRAAGSQRFRY